MNATIVIVRHGNTFEAGQPPRRIGLRTDLPLVASGREQGDRLGEHFAAQGRPFKRVLASPLLRTRQTAEIILRHQPSPPPIEPHAWLAEIDHGPDEDQPEDKVLARIGRQALVDWDERGIAPSAWIVDWEARLAGWRTLLAEASGDILVVTSNGAARFALLADARLATQAAELDSLKLPTGAYGRIMLSDAGPRLIDWGQRP